MIGRRAAGLAVLALASLLALEVGLRLVVLPNPSLVWRPLPPFGALTNERQRAWLERQRVELGTGRSEGIGRFDPELGWSYRPSSASDDGFYTINSRGWRGPREYPRDVAGGRLRVATFGDSYTFCQEVRDDATWQAALEEAWPELEVPNLGVGGYGTDQALLRFEREDLGTRVDAVLVGLLLENVGRNVNRYRPRWYPSADSPVAKPRFVLDGGELVLVPLPFATRAALVDAVESGAVLELLAPHEHWDDPYVPAWLRWSATARLLAGRRAYAERELPRLWAATDDEPFRVTVALLEAFDHRARAAGAREACVLVFPIHEDLRRYLADGHRYWSTLTDALETRGIPYLDLAVALAEAERARAPDSPSLTQGSHLSRAGNRVVAAAVEAWLRERL